MKHKKKLLYKLDYKFMSYYYDHKILKNAFYIFLMLRLYLPLHLLWLLILGTLLKGMATMEVSTCSCQYTSSLHTLVLSLSHPITLSQILLYSQYLSYSCISFLSCNLHPFSPSNQTILGCCISLSL